MRIKTCPHCGHPPLKSDQYILSDKPAWDFGCQNQECLFRPMLWEQRDPIAMIIKWNIRFDEKLDSIAAEYFKCYGLDYHKIKHDL